MPAQALLDRTVSVPEAIARVLEEAGIEFVFGMPGGRTIPIYDALYDHKPRIRTVSVREEGLAAVMADVYGRLTGRPGVCMGQAAFMLTNAGMGIVEAYLAGSPMLVLSDLSDGAPFSHHAPYQAGTGDYGNWDARNTIAGYTKRVFVAHQAAAAVQDTQLAVKHALTGQPGPVAVLYHNTALGGTVGPDTVPRLYSTPAYLQDTDGAQALLPVQVEGAIRLLSRAARPVVIAGNGVRMSRAQTSLRELAELLDLPVATTASGKGVFPETHPLALGVFGTFGLEAANAVVADADLILAAGTKLGPSDTANENPALLDPQRQIFIQVDVEPRHASWSLPVEVSLIGDARSVLDQLANAARRAEVNTFDGASRAARAHREYASFDTPHGGQPPQDVGKAPSPVRGGVLPDTLQGPGPIAPERLIKELHRALPENAIVTCDAGENRLFMMHHFQTKSGMEYLQPAGVGGMGYAIPAALAAKLVHPTRSVVAVCGDGGFAIAMNGLMTALEERIPIAVVVMNNSSLGWVRHGQGDRPIASEFGQFDHAAIARAMGCHGIRVEDPSALARALEQAAKATHPTVVDVVTSTDLTFKDVRSPLAAYP